MNTAASNLLPKKVTEAIKSVVGVNPADLHEPEFVGNEWNYLKDCLDTGYVSSVGQYVDRFERNLESFTGAKHAIAVVNGTSALHIALILAGIESGDEVLIPALTFVATANAVTYLGATPHFVDSERQTLGIDAQKLKNYLQSISKMQGNTSINRKTGRRIRAIVPMHTFGHPSDLTGLIEVANEFNLVLVEDAAESLGSRFNGSHTGTFGKLGILSFNGNKIITTGGGGAILTSDTELAMRAKQLTTTSKIPHKWEFRHSEIAYNYRLPNINAALGCAQIENVEFKIAAKRELYIKYYEVFSKIEGVHLMREPNGSLSNYWLQTLLIDDPSLKLRDEILEETNNAGYRTRPAWNLLSDLDQFGGSPKSDLTESHQLMNRIINLPSSPKLARIVTD